MKKLAVLFAVASVSAWSQAVDVSNLDLSSLDKLASKASEVNKVSLNHDQLMTALKMMPDDKKEKKGDQMQGLLQGLDSVQVRNFEFEKSGQFSDSDLDAVRAQVSKMKSCNAIVDSKEKNEHSQIFMCSENGKPSGLAVISAESKELTVVFVKGNLNFADMGKLGGLMGMPHMDLGPDARSNGK